MLDSFKDIQAWPTAKEDNVVGLPSVLRFAVGAFDSWQQHGTAVQGLRWRGIAPDSFHCLALECVLADNSASAILGHVASVQRFALPNNHESIGCTSGVLADLLDARVRSGAQSLKEALGHWLIPRHASHF